MAETKSAKNQPSKQAAPASMSEPPDDQTETRADEPGRRAGK